MDPSPPAPFTRRTATILLAAAAAVFLVGVVALAVGRLEVATACAAIFAVGWLGMRSRMKRLKREAEEAEEKAIAAAEEGRGEEPRRGGSTVRSRHSERRRRRP